MSGTDAAGAARSPADAELADAMNSIGAIGEDWRSRERGTDVPEAHDTGASEHDADASEEKEGDHG